MGEHKDQPEGEAEGEHDGETGGSDLATDLMKTLGISMSLVALVVIMRVDIEPSALLSDVECLLIPHLVSSGCVVYDGEFVG